VYVDQYGATINPTSKNDPVIVTVTAGSTSVNIQKPAHAPAVPTHVSEPAPVASSPTPKVPSAPVQGIPSSSTKEAAPPRSSAPVGSGSKPGIVYSPYNADGSCKSKEQVAGDIEKLKDFSPIRLYGVDCQQIQNVIAATKQHGTQVIAAVYDVEKVGPELQTLIEAVGSDWNSVHTVAIGNEVVNFGRMSANDYAGVIKSSRGTLRSAGYNGPVVGIDTFVAIMSNPAICEASDYVAANCHPFFDESVLPAQSGEFLDNMKKEMAKVCGDKKIIITGESKLFGFCWTKSNG
jgi:exo-beta-1,3-glucanase (GH17 family)